MVSSAVPARQPLMLQSSQPWVDYFSSMLQTWIMLVILVSINKKYIYAKKLGESASATGCTWFQDYSVHIAQ